MKGCWKAERVLASRAKLSRARSHPALCGAKLREQSSAAGGAEHCHCLCTPHACQQRLCGMHCACTGAAAAVRHGAGSGPGMHLCACTSTAGAPPQLLAGAPLQSELFSSGRVPDEHDCAIASLPQRLDDLEQGAVRARDELLRADQACAHHRRHCWRGSKASCELCGHARGRRRAHGLASRAAVAPACCRALTCSGSVGSAPWSAAGNPPSSISPLRDERAQSSMLLLLLRIELCVCARGCVRPRLAARSPRFWLPVESGTCMAGRAGAASSIRSTA